MAPRTKMVDAQVLGEAEFSSDQFPATSSDHAPMMEIDEEEKADLEYQAFLKDINAMSDSGRVKVYKLENGLFKSQMYLFDCAPAEFNENLLSDPDYHSDGFHDFRIVGRDRTGIVTAKTLKIFPRKDFKKPGAIDASAPAPDMNAIIAPIMAVIAQASENTNKILAAMAEQNKPAPQKTTIEMLHEVAAMKNLFASDAPRVDPMEQLQKTMEIAKLLNPPEGGASGMDAMIKALEMFTPMLGVAMAAKTQTPEPAPQLGYVSNPAPRHVQAASVAPAQSAPTQIPTENTEEPEDMLFVLKQSLKFLCKNAANNADPALYAELVLDQVSDEDLSAYLMVDSWFDSLCAIQPICAAHKEWFTELREEIKKVLTESGEADKTAGTVNNSDTAPNAIIDADNRNISGN